MKNQMLSHKIFQILGTIALAVPLLLDGFSPASAPVADAGVVGREYNSTSQDDARTLRHRRDRSKKPLALNSSATFVSWGENPSAQDDARTLRHRRDKSKRPLAFSSDTTLLGWDDTSSSQIDVDAALAAGRTKGHGRKRII